VDEVLVTSVSHGGSVSAASTENVTVDFAGREFTNEEESELSAARHTTCRGPFAPEFRGAE
jgi:hypothetical protein